MKTDYEFRQEEYQRALSMPQNGLPGFARYKDGRKEGHVILGEDHSVASKLAIIRALDLLLWPGGKALVLSETPRGIRNYTITDVYGALSKRGELHGWQDDSIELLVEKGAHLKTQDSRRLLRLSSANVDRNAEVFMRASQRREFLFADEFLGQMGKYDMVIGVYGSMHVVSPIFDRMLPDIARYVFKGFQA